MVIILAMAKYLSQEWVEMTTELAQALPERIGATGRAQWVVTDSPDGEVEHFQVWDSGHLVDAQRGRDPDADFTMTLSYADSAAIQRQERDAGEAYRKGDLRVDGDLNKLFALLPLIGSTAYREWQAEIAARTEF